jgi:hypothetical protein
MGSGIKRAKNDNEAQKNCADNVRFRHEPQKPAKAIVSST